MADIAKVAGQFGEAWNPETEIEANCRVSVSCPANDLILRIAIDDGDTIAVVYLTPEQAERFAGFLTQKVAEAKGKATQCGCGLTVASAL